MRYSERFGLKSNGYMDVGMALYNAYYHKEIGPVNKEDLDESDLKQLLNFMKSVTGCYRASIETLSNQLEECLTELRQLKSSGLYGKTQRQKALLMHRINKEFLLDIYEEYKDIYISPTIKSNETLYT